MLKTATFTALALGLLLAAQTASAQVHRCTDPKSGRVTYSNVGCSDGEQTRQIERQRSDAELQAERADADAARLRFESQQSREVVAARSASEAAAPAPAFRANQFECERALRNADTAASSITSRGRRDSAADREANIKCYGTADAAEIEKARAGATRVKVQNTRLPNGMARCDGTYCYDAGGIAYFMPAR